MGQLDGGLGINGSKGYAWVNWVAWVGIGAGGALALALALG